MYWGLLPSSDTFLEQIFTNKFSSILFNFWTWWCYYCCWWWTNKGTQIFTEVCCYLFLIHFWNKKIHQCIFFHLILDFELGDVTFVANDEQIKAHKYVLSFATFFDTFLKQIIHQNILIHLILNFEFGDNIKTSSTTGWAIIIV